MACSLGADREERIADWRRALAGAPRERLSHGVRIELPVSDLGAVSALAVDEQECCPFLGFAFALRGPVFDLTVTAPQEGMSMLDELLDDVPATPSVRSRG